MELDLPLDSLRQWARDAGSRLVVVFGSRASGRSGPMSDLDVAVDFPELPEPLQRLRIMGEIQDRLGSTGADVVFLHPGTDPVLRFEIFRSGQPIHEAEPGLFVREKVRALKLYEDALPFRRLRRRTLRRLAEEDRLVP
jgi:predicted nucleotidyltransferase